MDVKTAARWVVAALFTLFLVGIVFQLWQVGELVFDPDVSEISDVHKDVGQILQFSGIVLFLVALAGRFSAKELIWFAVFAVLAFLQAGFAEGEGLTFTNRLHVINPLVLSAIAAVHGWRLQRDLRAG